MIKILTLLLAIVAYDDERKHRQWVREQQGS